MKRFYKVVSIIVLISFFSSLFAPVVYAEGIVPATDKTYKYDAPNGVPVVNIATPNAKGLSHNRYHYFNVDKRGAVLNNTSEVGKSQLAGAIRGNPNIKAGQEANIILNEVVSPNRSTLGGFVEVKGKRADVIIANPYGITVNGGGFINTNRAVLTTGRPQIDSSGNLQGFKVEGGDILFQGAGIDATQVNYLDLVTRSIEADGQINAKNLYMALGRNYWDFNTRLIKPLNDDGSDKPAYALDSTIFGGMYADKIEIVATEDGVGVKMAGDMAANTDAIQITANGRIELKNNKMSANTDVKLTSTSSNPEDKISITGDEGSVTARRDILIDSQNTGVEINQSALVANRNIGINAVSFSDTGVITDSVQGIRSAKGDIRVETEGETDISGTRWVAGNNLTFLNSEFYLLDDSTQLFSGADANQVGRTLSIKSSLGDINLNGGYLASSNKIEMDTPACLNVLSGDRQKIVSGGDILLKIGDSVNNAGIFQAGRDFFIANKLEGDTLNVNTIGTLQAEGMMDISGYQGDGDVNLTNQDSGKILAHSFNLHVIDLFNDENAGVQSDSNGSFLISNLLDNRGKLNISISEGNDVTLTVGTLKNSGTIQSFNGLSLNITHPNSLINYATGKIVAGKDLTINSLVAGENLQLENSGLLQSYKNLTVRGFNDSNAVTLSNKTGGQILGQNLDLKVDSLVNESDATIQGDDTTNIDVTNNIENAGVITVSADTFGSDDTIKATSINNSGVIQSYDNSNFNFVFKGENGSGDFCNLPSGKIILPQATLNVASESPSSDTSSSYIYWETDNDSNIYAKNINLKGFGNDGKNFTLNNNGKIIAANDLTLNSFTSLNSGVLQAGGNLTLNLDSDFTNDSNGAILGTNINLQADNFYNYGILQGGNQSSLNITHNLYNYTGGEILSSTQANSYTDTITTYALHNYGIIQSLSTGGLNLRFNGSNGTGILHNYNGASILALNGTLRTSTTNYSSNPLSSYLDINNETNATIYGKNTYLYGYTSYYRNVHLTNYGNIIGGNSLILHLPADIENHGLLQTGGNLDLSVADPSAYSVDNYGNILVGGSLSVHAKNIKNESTGVIQATTQSTLNAESDIYNYGTMVTSTDSSSHTDTLQSKNFIYNIGTIQAGSSLDINFQTGNGRGHIGNNGTIYAANGTLNLKTDAAPSNPDTDYLYVQNNGTLAGKGINLYGYSENDGNILLANNAS